MQNNIVKIEIYSRLLTLQKHYMYPKSIIKYMNDIIVFYENQISYFDSN